MKAKKIFYRNFKDFKDNNFNQDLRNKLSAEYAPFENIFLDVLSKLAPFKKKVVRANNAPYITKALQKAIMKGSYLEKCITKKELRTRSENSKTKQLI